MIMRRIFVLSIILQFSFIGYAQTKSAKLEKRINGYFIVDNNLTYKIDDKLLLAKLKPGKSLKNGIRGTNASPSGIIRISVPDNSDPGGYMSYLEQTGDFEFVDFNGYYTPYMTPNDSYISDQWYLNNINIYNAWNITTGSSSVKVAVIDVGVSSSHPDLSSNLSPYEGFDYVNNTCPSIIGDRHGTMVAGIISARTNNNMGIAGIAGGNNSAGVKIIPYRTDLTDNDIISALDDAVSKGAKVVNMSFGGAGYNYALSQSITNAYNNGVTIICASGNSNATQLPYPAGYPNTIAVGASNQSNER